MWYKVGTVSVTNGSTTVTGSGTDWVNGAATGEAFLAPDGRVYEISAIVSATQITLGSGYLGSTAGGQSYQILPSQSFIRDLANQAADLVNSYGGVLTTAGAGKFDDGTLSQPGVAFVADQDTGIRRTGTNTLALVSGGVDKVSVGATVVVDGTTIPTSKTLVTTTDTQTLTGKTIDLSSNTLVATSAQLAAAMTDESGTSSLAFTNSPTFTGTPLAPTAAAATNTTQIATTAFVRTEVANLVAAAPAALDTLNEISAALGNDANFATTVTNALAAKAPLASPGLTGTPTAPTAAAGTNSTQLATTAFAYTEAQGARAQAVSDMSNSPTFTGTPLAPTAEAGTNTTQLATTAFAYTEAQGARAQAVSDMSNSPVRLNPRTITADLTIASAYNAASTGPIIIAPGIIVTVQDNATWSIN